MFKNYLFLSLVILSIKIDAMEQNTQDASIPFQQFILESLANDSIQPLESPRSNITNDCLLILPDDVILLIIFQLLEPLKLGEYNFEGNTDPLNFKKAHLLILPFSSSCRTTYKLCITALDLFYLKRLKTYSRSQKIKWAQLYYTNKHPRSVAYLLGFLLVPFKRDAFRNNYFFFKKLISGNFLSIENDELQFSLTENDQDNEYLKDLILELMSDKDGFVTIDTILKNILASQNKIKLLNYFITHNTEYPNKYITTSLMKHCFYGDIETVKSHIHASPEELLTQSPKGFDAVTWALIGGDQELLEYLFSYLKLLELPINASPNSKVLHLAALYASPETLDFLLNYLSFQEGIKLEDAMNIKDNNNQSPLNLAIINGSESKTLLFLNKGANLRTILETGLNSYSGKSKMLKLLIKHQSMIDRIALEISDARAKKVLSVEDVILCCKISKRERRKTVSMLSILGTAVMLFMGIAEVIFK